MSMTPVGFIDLQLLETLDRNAAPGTLRTFVGFFPAGNRLFIDRLPETINEEIHHGAGSKSQG
jgi:hypothetical protein